MTPFARRRLSLVLFLSILGLAGAPGCGGGGTGGGGTDESEGEEGDGDGGGGGGGGGGGTGLADTRVVAVNDLGMHCMDREYSVFSILPPYNVLHAQVVRRSPTGAPRLLTGADVDVTYGAVADATGSINSRSAAKTDFWTHASALFGAALSPGQGLKGLFMPGDAPTPGAQAVAYDAGRGWFAAEGIPITPVDDAGRENTYPLLRVTAWEKGTRTELGHLDVVVPVAKETDCSNCHDAGGIAASRAGVTWSTATDRERRTKENVLLLHDATHGTRLVAAQPVLCAACHYSPALDLAGAGPQGAQRTLPTMSAAMHAHHGGLRTAAGAQVFPSGGSAASTCYQCHPGAITQCARGAMRTGGMECLDCHGDMAAVGGAAPLRAGGSLDGSRDGASRLPWADLPRCASCHTGDAVSHRSGAGLVMAPDGIRLQQAWVTGDPAASPILSPTSRFKEQTGTLYRFSKGHGGLLCQTCHGSTHAEWPNATAGANDNVASIQLQGHAGVISECTACHLPGTLPLTTAGPHGMHNVADARWIDENHGDFFERDPAGCKACHGVDLRGTALSRASADRTFRVDDAGTVRFSKGAPVGCSHCHSIPR